MKRRRHAPEQIVPKLAVADKLLGEGKTVEEVCRELEMTESTFHRWRNQFGAMKADDAKRLSQLEADNARLKKIVADNEVEIDVLCEVSRGNF